MEPSGRSSLIDSLRGITLSGARIDKDGLRAKITFPRYLRVAMREAIQAKSASAASRLSEAAEPAEWPTVVFINSKSGGRHGPELKGRLEEQVFDLSTVKPHEFVQYGLSCLDNFASLGDACAQQTREKLRVVVVTALSDGSSVVSESLISRAGCLSHRTGNDLSRSFGWGGSFPFNWKSSVKRTLDKVARGPTVRLDSWRVLISMRCGEELDTPYSLKATEETPLDTDLEVEGEKVSCYQGVIYNYFSIGMDAQVARGFHHLRNERPYLARGPNSNKIIYSGYSCMQGWFFTPCISGPGLRSLKNILRLHVKKVNQSKWDQISVPSGVRSIVALNLPSYGGGRNPWGKLKPDYLENRGFVEAHADDGFLEIFGSDNGKTHCPGFSYAVRAQRRRMENSYMQMDGEPWKQPMDNDFSTYVEIKRVPHQSVMIRAAE